MSAVLELIGEAFVFLAQRIADIICGAFLLASLPAVWRWGFISRISREEWRIVAVLNFFAMIGDLLMLIPLAVSLGSWRLFNVLPVFANLDRDRFFYDYRFHGEVMYSFVNLFADVVGLLAFVLAHLPFWRLRDLYMKLEREAHDGIPLLPCACSGRGTRLPTEHSTRFRHIIIEHLTETKMVQKALLFLLDMFMSVLGLILIVTGIRATAYLADCKRLWTAHQQWDDFRNEWRKLTLVHVAWWCRDMLCLPFVLVVIASVYRGALYFVNLLPLIRRWAPFDDTAIQIQHMHFERRPDSNTGMLWRIRGTKKAEFTLPPGCRVDMHIRSGDDFWSNLGERMGSTVAAFARAFLPLRLDGAYLDPATLSAGSTDVDLVIKVNTAYSTERIVEFFTWFGNTVVFLQIEFAGGAGTLFCCGVNCAEAANALSHPADATPLRDRAAEFAAHAAGKTDGERFCDVWWSVGLSQFAWLVADVLAVVGFVLVHCVPHRMYAVYTSMCQGPERRKCRELLDEVDRALELVGTLPDSLETLLVDTDQSTRRQLMRRGEGTVSDIAAPFQARRAALQSFTSPASTAAQAALNKASTFVAQCVRQLNDAYAAVHGAATGSAGFAPALAGSNAVAEVDPPVLLPLLVSATDPRPAAAAPSQGDGLSPPDDVELDIMRRASLMQRELAGELERAREVAAQELLATACCDAANDGWSGVRVAVATQVAQTLYDAAPVLAIALAVCTVYRLPWLIRELWHSRFKRETCVSLFKEVAIDVMHLFMLVFVIITIRGTLKVLTDLPVYLMRYPSFAVGRAVIGYHFSLVINGMWIFATLFFSCRAIKFAAATAAFAVVSPAVMLEGAIVRRPGDCGQCGIGMLFLVASFWMFGIPFVAASTASPGEITTKPATIYFAFAAAMIGVAFVIWFTHLSGRTVSLRRPVVRFARPSWHNVLPFVFVALEAAQWLALSFGAAYAAGAFATPSKEVVKFAQYAFLLFGEDWTKDSLAFGGYLCIAIMAVQFLLASMPIVTGYLLKWNDGDDLVQSPTWLAALTFLAYTLQLTVSRNVAELLSCENGCSTYTLVSGNVAPAELVVLINGTNSTAAQPMCWAGGHRGLAIAAMILCVYYLPSSLTRSTVLDERFLHSADIAFPQFYRTLTGISAVVAAVLAALLPRDGKAVLIVVLVASLWSLVVSLGYGKLINPTEGAFCTLPAMEAARVALHLGSAVAAVLCFAHVNHGTDLSNLWPVYASVAVMAGLIVLGVVGTLARARCSRTPEDDTFDAAREALLAFETEAFSNDKLHARWRSLRDAWARSVRSCLRVSELALLIVKLESNLRLLKVSPLFVNVKREWLSQLVELVDEGDKEADIDLVISKINARDRHWSFGDCEAECLCLCCGERRSYRDDWGPSHAVFDVPQEHVRKLEQLVQSLANAVKGSGPIRLDAPAPLRRSGAASDSDDDGGPPAVVVDVEAERRRQRIDDDAALAARLSESSPENAGPMDVSNSV